MSSSNTIQEELNSLNSQLPSGLKGEVYAVPEGYFEGLASAVLTRIRENEVSAKDEIAMLSPLLAGISRQMPLTVPDQYFQSTIDTLPVLLTEDETSLVLSFVDKNMPNEVPSDYFENFSGELLRKLRPQPKGKLIPMRRRLTQWAAAAMVAGVILVSGIFYFRGNRDIPVDNPNWVADKLKNVSDTAIVEFVNTTDASMATVHKDAARTTDVTSLLKDVSDKELDAFLKQIPADEEELLN